MLFILVFEAVFAAGVFALAAGRCVCLCIFPLAGIPGVGVTPGFIGFPMVFRSGIPGVGGVPLGIVFTASAAGIPGVVFVEGGNGLVENSGGMLFALTTTAVSEFRFEFVFTVSLADPQARLRADAVVARTNNDFFNIKLTSKYFKIAVPA